MTLGHRRVAIKLGTNTLCDPDGTPDSALMAALAAQLHDLRQRGHQFIIISSGAIGAGRAALRIPEAADVATRQACAAVGQHRLMHAWDEALGRHRMRAAQILVSADTFQDRHRYVNLRNCAETLLKLGAVPIVNENDTTCTEEIDDDFRDNDSLGALVAAKLDADLYVMLSDVEGLYDRPPHENGATILGHVPRIDDAVLAAAGNGDGGMRSKLESARDLTDAGVPVVIAYGRHEGILHSLLDPDAEERPGTWFDAVGPRDQVESWIGAAQARGVIEVDAGALKALQEGYHLLPAGVTDVEGRFPVESVVEIRHDGKTVGRAISMFSSHDLAHCIGKQSKEAREALGIDGTANITRKGRLVLH